MDVSRTRCSTWRRAERHAQNAEEQDRVQEEYKSLADGLVAHDLMYGLQCLARRETLLPQPRAAGSVRQL